MLRWCVYDQADDETPAMTLDADDERGAKAEWFRVMGLGEDDPDVDLDATPICPTCATHDKVIWVDAWRDWKCTVCKQTL